MAPAGSCSPSASTAILGCTISQTMPRPLGLARQQHPLPDRKTLPQEGLVEPDAAEMSTGSPAQRERPGRSVLEPVLRSSTSSIDPQDRLQRAFFELGDLAAVRQILVIAGKAEQRISTAPGASPSRSSNSARCGPTPFDELHRGVANRWEIPVVSGRMVGGR